jgi:RNA polymerase sigma-70 factor (ECF subfamily)
MQAGQNSRVVALEALLDQRSQDAIRAIVRRHDGQLRRYLGRALRNRDDVADALQDLYARLALRLRDGGDFEFTVGYLFKVADSVVLDRHRRSQARGGQGHTELPDSLASTAPSPFAQVRWKQNLDVVRAAVNSLPPAQRRVLLLHRLEELSLTEISEELGMPLRTVQRHLSNALLACRERFEAVGWFTPDADR